MAPLDVDSPAQGRVLGRDPAAFGDRTALVTADGEISYRDLADRVDAAGAALGAQRRLVLVAMANSAEAVVGYLGALAAGHVVLLAPDNDAAIGSLTATYDPDVVCRPLRGRWSTTARRAGSGHDLHPDLALLLSTSGSTGSPKLVRLSYTNLRSNAESIATYLGIRDSDRAATTLPLHYCYGLSVLHSHLVRGAAVILTGRSVTDPEFWELFRRARGTGLAGVPYTFTLLDRVGFATMELPHLRYVTQAGGRMDPAQVRRYAELGRRQGWDLFVMYGQTEATARMAYLPPDRALTDPAAIGVAVPGGSLRLEPADELSGPDVGELVYTGPNVMLGYAERPADLGLGRAVHELFTGDLARRTDDGLFEILGRRSRFVKVFGLRVDLQRVESGLAADGVAASCVTTDDELVVAVEEGSRREEIRRLVAARCGLPVRVVRVVVLPELPRLPSGKIDHRAVAALAAADTGPDGPDTAGSDLVTLYAEVLERPDATPDSTFTGLGGDSLSYVEMAVRLEQVLGALPTDWHERPIRELRSGTDRASPRRRRLRTVDTSVGLRAVAIVLVVGTHVQLFTVRGGAHLLLIMAGFNFARFHLGDGPRRQRVRHLAASIARVAVPTSLFLIPVVLLDDRYSWQNVLLLNEALGPRVGPQRYYWFVETLVYTLLALLALFASPVVDRWERRLPFALPVTLLAAGLTARYGLVPLTPWDNLATPVLLFWFFALGWAAGKARTWWHRCLLTVTGAVAVTGYFHTPLRETVIAVGLALLIWLPRLPSTVLLNRVAGLLAGGSLYIYLVHWQLYPLLDDVSKLLAVLVCLPAGVLFGAVVDRVTRRLPGSVRSVAAAVARRPASSFQPTPMKESSRATLPCNIGRSDGTEPRPADRRRGVRGPRQRTG